MLYIRVPNVRLPCICYTRETGMRRISVDVQASGTACNTLGSRNFRYDAFWNRNDRKPCVNNGPNACRFMSVIESCLSLKDFAGPSPPAGLAGTCLPARLSGCDPHCWMCVHVVLCSGACLQVRLSVCREDPRAGSCTWFVLTLARFARMVPVIFFRVFSVERTGTNL